MTCFFWGNLSILHPISFDQLRVVSSSNRQVGLWEKDASNGSTLVGSSCLRCVPLFFLIPLNNIFIMVDTSVISAFLWPGNWMSPTCLTNLPCISLYLLSMVMAFSETAWGFFVLFEMFLSGLFCPMTFYISFCLRMFCCLLLWLRGQGWILESLGLQGMGHTNPTLILRDLSLSKVGKCSQEKNYEWNPWKNKH